jgi:hypothetical protein
MRKLWSELGSRASEKNKLSRYLLGVTSEANDGLRDEMEPGNLGQESEKMKALSPNSLF